MENLLVGYKSYISAGLKVVVGLAALFGVAVDEDTAMQVGSGLEAAFGAMLVVWGLVDTYIRKVTTGPAAL